MSVALGYVMLLKSKLNYRERCAARHALSNCTVQATCVCAAGVQ